MMRKVTKRIFTILLFIFVVSLLPIFKGKNIYKYVSNSVNNPIKKLSAERQAVYDKMKVSSLNIKGRKTGTAPFNSGSVSNIDGVDINDTDDYIRTFDKISYLVEVGVEPNTSAEGVTSTSIFNGGVIKVKATLPNQGSDTVMRWEKDAWMGENVSFEDDNRIMYAEYIVDKNTSISNSIQNLSFTVKIDGYKKEITDDMKPTFEIWMEGNKPDNSESSAASLNIKDTKNIIISGHPSYDVHVSSPSIINHDTLDGKKGQYDSFGIALALRQDVSGFNDLRGIEYPKGKIDVDLSLNLQYKNGNAYVPLSDLNGTKLIAYSVNMMLEEDELFGKYYPKNVLHINAWDLPYGRNIGISSDGYTRGVQDTGNVVANFEGNNITVSFDNYVLNGKFPNSQAANPGVYPNTLGYFAVANVQLFTPFYVDSESNIHEELLNVKAKEVVDFLNRFIIDTVYFLEEGDNND